jgi:ABC-2 type transport system ATP-binding protein
MPPSPSPIAAVRVEQLGHDYRGRAALQGVEFEVATGEMFGLLGPNGSGKTTLFRILATLLRPAAGRALVFGHDAAREPDAVRARLGVVFQSPAVDRLLTVRENLDIHGRLYGLRGRELGERIAATLERLRLSDRAGDRVGILSGGLARRVEIAKGLLHRPALLLLDEPSTGLDPSARADLWSSVRDLRRLDGTTILFTTHLLEEAEGCDRVAILDAGRVVALGTPRGLREEIGGDVLVIATRHDPALLRADVERLAGVPAIEVDGSVRVETAAGRTIVPRLLEAFPDRIDALTLGRPTLFDVFVRRTGRRFESAAERKPGDARETSDARETA